MLVAGPTEEHLVALLPGAPDGDAGSLRGVDIEVGGPAVGPNERVVVPRVRGDQARSRIRAARGTVPEVEPYRTVGEDPDLVAVGRGPVVGAVDEPASRTEI